MTEEITTNFDKEAHEARVALENGIQGLYVNLITGDHVFQGTYIPVMINLLDQWITIRDRINNKAGTNGWFINRINKIVNNVAIEVENANVNRSSVQQKPSILPETTKLMEKVISVIITEKPEDTTAVLRRDCDVSNLRVLKQHLNRLNAARAEAVYLERQEDLMRGTSYMMGLISDIVFQNNLVKLKEAAWSRSEHAKSLDPKKPQTG